MSALDGLFGGSGTAKALKTTGADVDVAASSPPSAGQIPIATDATHATWQNFPESLAYAFGLRTTDADNPVVTVAAPPSAGQVLKATSANTAAWGQGGYMPASIHVPPTLLGQTPDADDEECDGTTISTAWRAYLDSSHALLTPGVGLLPWTGTPNTARWEQGVERASCLTLEAPYGDGMRVTKALAPLTTANTTPRWVAYSRCILEMRHGQGTINGTMPEGVFVFSLFKDNAGVPDWDNHVDITVFPYWASGGPTIGLYFDTIIATNFTRVWSHEINGSASVGSTAYADRIEISKFGFFHDGGGNVGAFIGDEWTLILGSSGTAGGVAIPFDFGHVGILQLRGINIGPSSHCHIDYFRIRRPLVGAPTNSSPRLP